MFHLQLHLLLCSLGNLTKLNDREKFELILLISSLTIKQCFCNDRASFGVLIFLKDMKKERIWRIVIQTNWCLLKSWVWHQTMQNIKVFWRSLSTSLVNLGRIIVSFSKCRSSGWSKIPKNMFESRVIWVPFISWKPCENKSCLQKVFSISYHLSQMVEPP